MLGRFGRQAIDLAVLLLALYAFAFVPLGQRTGLEHVRAILATPAARSAGREIVTAADRLRQRLLTADDRSSGRPVEPPGRGNPQVPRLPEGRPPADLAISPHHTADRPDASQ